MSGAEDRRAGSDRDPASYDPVHYATLHAVEDRHFWFDARRRAVVAALEPYVAELGPGYVLEIGCGTGVMLDALQRTCGGCTVVGMDLLPQGLRYAKDRGHSALVQADVFAFPFRVTFSLIGLFDVLEHLADHAAALSAIRQTVRRGGLLAVTVPAGQFLWSQYDVAARHVRRYDAATLRDVLGQAGFDVEYGTHFLAGAVPLVWARRRLLAGVTADGVGPNAAGRIGADELRVGPVVNAVLRRAFSWEPWVIHHRGRLPFGTSLLAIARAR